jgi:hypothetical protein
MASFSCVAIKFHVQVMFSTVRHVVQGNLNPHWTLVTHIWLRLNVLFFSLEQERCFTLATHGYIYTYIHIYIYVYMYICIFEAHSVINIFYMHTTCNDQIMVIAISGSPTFIMALCRNISEFLLTILTYLLHHARQAFLTVSWPTLRSHFLT